MQVIFCLLLLCYPSRFKTSCFFYRYKFMLIEMKTYLKFVQFILYASFIT